uniref:Uncharacterized protein n=1 Tax=Romanomermis culicivorax TaxID=13658 RepID=A0A915J5E6_ROMCU
MDAKLGMDAKYTPHSCIFTVLHCCEENLQSLLDESKPGEHWTKFWQLWVVVLLPILASQWIFQDDSDLIR